MGVEKGRCVWGWAGCFSPDLVTQRSSGIALQGTWPSLRAPTVSTASKVPAWGVWMWCGSLSPAWPQTTLEDSAHGGPWGGTGPAASVCSTQIPWGMWQVWPSPGLKSDHGIEGSQRHWGAQKGMGAQCGRGLVEGLARGMETWQDKGVLSRCTWLEGGPWGVGVGGEVPSGLGRGSWPRVQRLRRW